MFRSNENRRLFVTIVVTVSYFGAACAAKAVIPPRIVDQSSLESHGARQILAHMPLGQEFTPSLPRLVGVEVGVSPVNPGHGDDIITLNIREGTIDGNILVSVSEKIEVPFNGLMYFGFPSPAVEVAPGSVYVIELVATKKTFGWWCDGQGYDAYPGGRAILNGSPSELADQVFQTYAPTPKAWDPYPADGATDVPVDVVLRWQAGDTAVSHDIYFGTDFDAVDNADTSDTTGIYRGRQDANSYTPPETIEPDMTYYWRVDGINNLHPDSPWKGDLWSFTGGSEPNEPNEPKWKTGYKGYYTTDEENTVVLPCWTKPWNEADSNNQIKVTLKAGEKIWFAFINLADAGKNKRKYFQLILKGDAVSNLNKPDEVKGFKDIDNKKEVKVRRCGGPRFGRHEGKVTRRFRYRFGPPQPFWVRFKFKAKKEITDKKITIMAWSICCRVDYWKTGKWPDLPEVKSFGIGGPGAESGIIGVTNIENYVFSIWDASFLSQSPGAVIGDPRITDIYVFPDSSTVNTLVPPNFSADPSTGNWTTSFVYTDPNGDSRPQGGVRFASDGPGLDTSDRFNLQIFSTGQIDSTYELYAYDQDSGQYMDFGIDVDIPECNEVVDDMESYTNDLGNRIFETWRDGRGYFIPPWMTDLGNGTGSAVDLNSVTVYQGAQSMKFGYDNTGTGTNIFTDPITVYYSETERTFDPPQDWTKDGIKALSLWFIGDPNNDAERMYIAVEDNMGMSKLVNHDNPGAALIDTWQEWNIDLRDISDAGVDLTNVRKMYIGVGDRDASESCDRGTLYFDNIRLCPTRCVPEYGPEADLTGDCIVDLRDLAFLTSYWLKEKLWP